MEGARHKIPGTAGRRGFTLVEIIVVLMLIGMIASVLITGATSMLDAREEKDPEAALLMLLQKIRGQAVESGQIIELVQLPEDKGFLWGADGVESLPLVKGGPRARLLKPEFSGASLIGGQMEETPLERLRFYPDGSCDPTRIEVRRADARRVLTIDPWTAAPLPAPGGGPAS